MYCDSGLGVAIRNVCCIAEITAPRRQCQRHFWRKSSPQTKKYKILWYNAWTKLHKTAKEIQFETVQILLLTLSFLLPQMKGKLIVKRVRPKTVLLQHRSMSNKVLKCTLLHVKSKLIAFTFSFLQLTSVTRKKLPNVYKSCQKLISLEKWKILTSLQKLPKNGGDLGKKIAAKGFKKLSKVQ